MSCVFEKGLPFGWAGALRRAALTGLGVFTLVTTLPAPAYAREKQGAAAGVSSLAPMVQTNLFFGPVQPDRWNRFLAEVVTPRFPRGLTWLDVNGQWRGRDGVVRRLPSRMLIIVHTTGFGDDRAIAEIQADFKKRFHQAAVLRVSSPVRVSF